MKSIFYLIVVIAFLQSCNNNEKHVQLKQEGLLKKNEDSLKKFISSIDTTIVEEINGNWYHNISYKFSLRFPYKWSFIKQIDSVKRFYIMKLPTSINAIISKEGIEHISNEDIEEIKRKEIQQMKDLNYVVKDIQLEKRHLKQIPALFKNSRVIGKLGDIDNVEMIILSYILNTQNHTAISITYALPAIFFNKKESQRFSIVLNSFKFDE